VQTLKIKISSKKVDNGWKGYWKCIDPGVCVESISTNVRTNEYDAEKDAINSAKLFSQVNKIIIFTGEQQYIA
jgi:hypothetical protein